MKGKTPAIIIKGEICECVIHKVRKEIRILPDAGIVCLDLIANLLTIEFVTYPMLVNLMIQYV